MPAASAVATLTITSPAAAADASRAVMLTASPSAVKSSTVVPSPVAPTNASPVWTAVHTGMATADAMLPRAARSASSIAAAAAAACRGQVIPPKKSPNIDRNVLEWRLDPTSGDRLPVASRADIRFILVCNEGYSSSLAAATLRDLGLSRATDLVGGFQALLAYQESL
jgi:rhodanese-related sulfurtransferase